MWPTLDGWLPATVGSPVSYVNQTDVGAKSGLVTKVTVAFTMRVLCTPEHYVRRAIHTRVSTERQAL